MRYLFCCFLVIVTFLSCSRSKDASNTSIFNLIEFTDTILDENGNLKAVKVFTYDKMVEEQYWENGNLKWESIYIRDSFCNNQVNGYSKDGQLLVNYNCRNGKLNGKAYRYYLDGSVLAEMEMKNDNKHGLDICFFSNGKIRSVVEYWNGMMIYCREESRDTTVLQEKFSTAYECSIRKENKELYADVNVYFGGFEFADGKKYFSYMFYKTSPDSVEIEIANSIALHSRDTMISFKVNNDEKYLLLIGYYSSVDGFRSFGCLDFEVIKNQTKPIYCEREINKFQVKIGQQEVESGNAYNELVGE